MSKFFKATIDAYLSTNISLNLPTNSSNFSSSSSSDPNSNSNSSSVIVNMEKEMRFINNSGKDLRYIAKKTDIEHLDHLCSIGLDIRNFSRQLLKCERDDIFDYFMDKNNQEIRDSLLGHFDMCTEYVLDKALAAGIIPLADDLFFAGLKGQRNRLEKFIIHGADINGKFKYDAYTRTLQGPLQNNDTDTTLYLISLGAKCKSSDLLYTIRHNNLVLFKALLDQGVELNPKMKLKACKNQAFSEEIQQRNL